MTRPPRGRPPVEAKEPDVDARALLEVTYVLPSPERHEQTVDRLLALLDDRIRSGRV